MIDEDLVSCLGWFTAEEDEHAAQRLLLSGPSDVEGRVSVYVCPECGDLYCGALTVVIERQGDELVWKEAAMSTFDWADEMWLHDKTDLPELRFDADPYRAVIEQRSGPRG